MSCPLPTVCVLGLSLARSATVAVTASVAVEAPPPPPPPPPPVEAAPVVIEAPAPTVELIVYAPGSELYAFWGHAAIRIIEPGGPDLVYNFGSVDFSGNFLLRLLRGRVDAFVAASSANRSFSAYRAEDRTIVRRRLAIEGDEARAIAARLKSYVSNDRYEYRYHHFVDNCSTRVAEEIDRAFGGALAARAKQGSDRTYRERSLDMVRPYTVLYAFLDIVMTDVIDHPIDRWQASFLPHLFADVIDDAIVDGKPAVAEKIVVYRSPQDDQRTDPGWPWVKIYLLFVIPLAALTYWRPRGGAAIVGLVFGLLGVAITLLWFGTTYDFVKYNVNLALFPPTHLGLFYFALGSDRFRRQGQLIRLYVWAHVLALFGLAIADAAHLIDQAIGPPLGLALPVTLVLAIEIRKLGT